MAGHVFLSHAAADREAADGLCAFIEGKAVKVWIAPRDVRLGLDYSEALQAAIESCAACVVLISAQGNASPYVRAETEMAFSNGKPIFPVRFAEIEPAPGLAFFLKIRHWTDAFGAARETNLARLGAELQALASAPETALPLPPLSPPPPAPPRKGAKARPLLGVGLALTAAVALILVLAAAGAGGPRKQGRRPRIATNAEVRAELAGALKAFERREKRVGAGAQDPARDGEGEWTASPEGGGGSEESSGPLSESPLHHDALRRGPPPYAGEDRA